MRIIAVFMLGVVAVSAINWRNVINHLNREVFEKIDSNKDGLISFEEVENFFRTFDADKDEIIEYSEFKKGVDKADKIFEGNEDLVYKLFDQDNDGRVTQGDISDSFIVVDENNDGLLSFEEINDAIKVATKFAIIARRKHLI